MGKRSVKRLVGLFSTPIIFLSSLVYAAKMAGPEYTTPSEGWDELWRELMIDIVVIGVIFAIVTTYLLIKYRRKSPNETGSATKLKPIAAFGWVLIPAFIFMADDIYLGLENLIHWRDFRNVPQNAYTVEATGRMWGYEIKYPEGITTQNEMRVPVGRPIQVTLQSSDVIHTMFIPDYRVKWDMLPGTVHYLWFYPKEAGEHVFTCTEFCGVLHSGMYGKLIVMPVDAFNKWVDENKPKGENKPKEGGAV